MNNQVVGLCENCIYRGLVTLLPTDQDNAFENVYQYFCKSNNLKVNGEPFIIPMYENFTDEDEGNLVGLVSQVVNCTEFIFIVGVNLTSVDYDTTYNSLTVTWLLRKGYGAYTVNVYSFDKQVIIYSQALVADGFTTVSFAYTAPVNNSRYFIALTDGPGTPANSNIYTLSNPAVVPYTGVLDVLYAAGRLELDYVVGNSSGVDTLKLYYTKNNGSPVLMDTIVNVPNGYGTDNIVITLTPGNYTFYCYLVVAGVTSNLWQLTIT